MLQEYAHTVRVHRHIFGRAVLIDGKQNDAFWVRNDETFAFLDREVHAGQGANRRKPFNTLLDDQLTGIASQL